MKCFECGAIMVERREDHRYTESGLSQVVLVDVVVRECPCGERELVLPDLEELHRSLAHAIASQPGRLPGEEIRYLRKWLGWSGADFAEHMGVDRTTTYRWETDDVRMPQAAEVMLRLLSRHMVPVESYQETVAAVSDPAERPTLGLRHEDSSWSRDGAAA